MADSSKNSPAVDLSRHGVPGLPRYSGWVLDEWLQPLQGARGRKVLREMQDDEPIIGALLFSLEMLLRQTHWSIEPGDESTAGIENALFILECWEDMRQPWDATLGEILTFLPYGWSLFEEIYKYRKAGQSKFTDGRIGWDSWSMRSQETLLHWEFDPQTGEAVTMVQLGPPDWTRHEIPLSKSLLFRTTTKRGNPEGRALDPETPIPTPNGWRTMDDLQPGDPIFDETGRIRYVTQRADWENRPCYRVEFADGSSIIADEAHQWVTKKLHERAIREPGKTRTTTQIAESVKNSNGVSNHSVDWAAALQYPEQIVPLDPYVLGLWLGDGTSRCAEISCHVDDLQETMDLISAAGYSVAEKQNGIEGCLGRTIRFMGDEKWDSSGPSVALRVLDLIQNKHIPAAYLRGSVDQRLALLSGLMDSDGTVDASGRCEFTNTNLKLIHGVAELVRSLGTGCRVSLRKRADGIDHIHDAWCVRFTPSWAPFRLSRKIARIIPVHARRYHYIASVEQVPPRRTVCIQVDSPSMLFLAGTSMVPTHNSILRNAYRPWFFKKHIETIEGIGIERDLAGLPVLYIPSDTIMGLAENSVLAYAEYQKVISNIKRDDNEGIILPSDRDEMGHRTHELTLLSASGNRQFNTDAIITRKGQEILMTTMTDFITLGHERVGSNALAQEKGRLFVAALEAWQQSIIGPINTTAIPRLLALNGMDISHAPVLKAGDVDRPDLDMLSNFVLRLAQAGFQMDLEAKGELLKRLMEVANLGEPNPNPTVFPVQVNVRNPEGGPDADPTALPAKPAAPQKAA